MTAALAARRKAAAAGARFDRGSWIALGIAVLILVYQVFPAVFTYTIPGDGWSMDVKTGGSGGVSSFIPFFRTHLVDGPSPLREGDVLLAVEGRPISELLPQWATFFPVRPKNWAFGQTVRYTIQRGGQTLDVQVPLGPLTAQAFFRHAFENWHSLWLTLFMFLFFTPVMVAIGLFVFFHRPRDLAAQALLIISVAFVGQLSYAPFEVACFFYGPLTVPAAFVISRWPMVIVPTALLLSLSFPTLKGPLRRHLAESLAVIYLPWIIGVWAVTGMNLGDITAIYAGWLILNLVEISLLLFLVGALVHSFRTARGAVERAQLKWFAAGLMGFVVMGGMSWVVGSLLNLPAFNTLINYFGYLFLPLCLAFAILRYRLWDIDLIIRRTLVYTILTAFLGLVFFAGVTSLQVLFTLISGQQSPASVVISTLLIAALFEPVRRRVQTFIDRRFYRQKYNAARSMEEFSDAARREVGMENLTGWMVEVVESTVQPEQVSVWIRDMKHKA